MKKKIRILHLEDDPLDQEIIKNILKGSTDFESEIICVSTRNDYIKELKNKFFDIILADYKLPSFDGLSALKISKKILPEVPFVFVSGAIGEEMAIESLKAGAKDYVVKNGYKRLIPSVNRAIVEAEEKLKRINAEKSLRESRNKLKMLFDSSPEGIFTINFKGKLIEANQAFINMMKYTETELKGIHFSKFIPGQFNNSEIDIIENVKEDGYGIFEKEFINKEGVKFPVSVINWLIYDKLGRPKEIGGFVRDNTEKKQLEKERHLHQEMSNQLERVTSLSHLSSAITHEIKQPLQSIKVLVDSILYLNKKGTNLTYDEVLNDLKSISDRVDRINNIINSIRSLIKTPNKLEIKEIDIIKQIYDSIEYLKDKLKDHDINLILDLSHDGLNAIASEIQFQQVIINIVDNAIIALDKSDKRNKKIIIQVRENDNFVIVKITDNGMGIKNEYIDKIFEAFYTFSDRNDRMGMGLFIVNNIIKCFGGKIEVENNNEGGSSFIITLRKKT